MDALTIGDSVMCRDTGVRLCLTLGGVYKVSDCAMVGNLFMVQLDGAAGCDLDGAPIWYQARRFVGIGKAAT